MGNNTFHTYFDLASEISPENICHYGLLGGVERDQSKKKLFFIKFNLYAFRIYRLYMFLGKFLSYIGSKHWK